MIFGFAYSSDESKPNTEHSGYALYGLLSAIFRPLRRVDDLVGAISVVFPSARQDCLRSGLLCLLHEHACDDEFVRAVQLHKLFHRLLANLIDPSWNHLFVPLSGRENLLNRIQHASFDILSGKTNVLILFVPSIFHFLILFLYLKLSQLN